VTRPTDAANAVRGLIAWLGSAFQAIVTFFTSLAG
jgi:hypothetical protein